MWHFLAQLAAEQGEGVNPISSAEEILQKSGAMLEGHFVLASGVHSPIYWEKFRVLQFPNYAEKLWYDC